MDEGPDRERAVRQATVNAISSSLAIGSIGAPLVDEAQLLSRIGNPHVEADLRVALEALRAGLEGANITAGSNLDLLARHRTPDDELARHVAAFERDISGLATKREECDLIIAAYRAM